MELKNLRFLLWKVDPKVQQNLLFGYHEQHDRKAPQISYLCICFE
jgi:hypothetical protein